MCTSSILLASRAEVTIYSTERENIKPEYSAGEHVGFGEGEEGHRVGGEDPEEEDVAELPARGHDDGDLVVDEED